MSDSKLMLFKEPLCQDPVEAYAVCSYYLRPASTNYRIYKYALIIAIRLV